MARKSGPTRTVLEGRYLIEIETWDWHFFIGAPPRPAAHPEEPVLIDARGISIEGKILAPRSHHGRRLRLYISPLRADYILRSSEPARIGELMPSIDDQWDFDATTHIPEETLGPVVQCLSTIWKYVHLWDDGRDALPSPIVNLTFSRDLPPLVREWISEN